MLSFSTKDRPSSLTRILLLVVIPILFIAGKCDKRIYQQPCGAPCKYGDHLLFVQTYGIKDSNRLNVILDSLGLERRSDLMLEPRYLITGKLRVEWLGERKKEMTMTRYNRILNDGILLFSPERDYLYRELLYSEKELTGRRNIAAKLRNALHMDLSDKGEVVGYVADLCSAYGDGCEKAYPSIVPIHKFGLKVENKNRGKWTKDTAYKYFPFLKEYPVTFYGESDGNSNFYHDKRKGTVAFGLEVDSLSCMEIQELGTLLGDHPLTLGMDGGSAMDEATPVDCSNEAVKVRSKPDL